MQLKLLHKGQKGSVSHNMKVVIDDLAEKNSYFKELQQQMPSARSKLYKDIQNTVQSFTFERMNHWGKSTQKTKTQRKKAQKQEV